MKSALRFLAGASSLLVAATARATNLTYTDPVPPPMPSMAGLLARTGIALALVVGLIYATAWMLRRAQAGTGLRSPRKSREPVAVESHVALGPRRSLYSVRWGKFRLLLGAGSSEISLLASEWAEGETASEPQAELPDAASFGRHLDDFLSRLGRVEDEPRS